jgi:hypothetical protein
MNKKTVIVLAIIVPVFFLAGCDWDFGPVDQDHRGVFDYNPQAGLFQTITVVI